MLVLSRGIDEGIMIGDNICVTVVRINGGVIRIGIEAPKETPILRGEHLLEPPAAVNGAQQSPRTEE